MKIRVLLSSCLIISISFCLSWAEPSLTIYNQDFAVIRDEVNLTLEKGVNQINFTGATSRLEPDSVILRDPTGKHKFQILEQNYRSDTVTEALLLNYYEGKTIDFEYNCDNKKCITSGKIIRSGYIPGGGKREPIIEVAGKLRFSLPGLPLFPALNDKSILNPTLHWVIETNRSGKVNAEVAYITGGLKWEADYNLIAPQKGDVVDFIGWVTLENKCGRAFENASIKLMAGDVNKLQPDRRLRKDRAYAMMAADVMAPPVTEKTFDEYHLYSLRRKTTLHDSEIKQVEFVRATDVKSKRIYVYDGAQLNNYWQSYGLNQNKNYGTQCNKKIWVMQEFENTEENNLGIPLPKGRLRFYRQDDDGSLQFTGENEIDHTPKDETIRVYTGNSFDLVGERKQTDFKVDSYRKWIDESFEIRVRNHKKAAVEVRVVEHLYRWSNWEIKQSSHTYNKTDNRTIEFPVSIPPDKEAVIRYSVHYWW